jgi:hypothetical protein
MASVAEMIWMDGRDDTVSALSAMIGEISSSAVTEVSGGRYQVSGSGMVEVSGVRVQV